MNPLAVISAGLLAAASIDLPPHFHPENIGCGDVAIPGTQTEASFVMATAPTEKKRVRVLLCSGFDFEKCPYVAIIRGKGPHALSWVGTTLIVHGEVDPIKLTRQVPAIYDTPVSVRYVRRMPLRKDGLWFDRRNCRLRGPIVGFDP